MDKTEINEPTIIEKIKGNLPLLIAVTAILSILTLHLFYIQFDVNVIPLLTVSEIIKSIAQEWVLIISVTYLFVMFYLDNNSAIKAYQFNAKLDEVYEKLIEMENSDPQKAEIAEKTIYDFIKKIESETKKCVSFFLMLYAVAIIQHLSFIALILFFYFIGFVFSLRTFVKLSSFISSNFIGLSVIRQKSPRTLDRVGLQLKVWITVALISLFMCIKLLNATWIVCAPSSFPRTHVSFDYNQKHIFTRLDTVYVGSIEKYIILYSKKADKSLLYPIDKVENLSYSQ